MNFKKLMLSTLLVLSTSLQAQDQIGWGDPGVSGRDPWQDNRPTDPRNPSGPRNPSNPGSPRDPRDSRDPWESQDQRDPWGNQQGSTRDVELQVNQYFQNQARLDLLQDAYTRSQLQGKRIQEVTVTASTEAGNGQARLLINGQALESAKTVARQMARYTFRVDSLNLRTLELEMRGRFYVEKVVFSLIQNGGPINPGPGTPSQPQIEVVRQQLNENIQGEGGLQLFRLFNLSAERQGQSLRRVTVLARSQRGSAQGQLLINDQNSGISQNIGMGSTRLSFDLSGQRIGREIQGLRLHFRGNIVIEEVSLEFERGGSIPGPGPIQDRRIEQVINQRLYETNGINLISLLRIDRRDEDRIVDSVELVVRNSDYGTRVKLCQLVQEQRPRPGQGSVLNCGNISILNPGSQIVRLSSVNFAKLSELSLSVRMGMIDIDRIIINLR